MLSKQSIRKGVDIYINGKKVDKDYIISLSSQWTEIELERFQKLLKQGGRSYIQGQSYRIARDENKIRNSQGEYDEKGFLSPGADDRF